MIESYKPSYWQQKCMRISWQWKNICHHTKPIQLVCEVGRKTCFFISISAVSYFEASGQNHIHFRLIQVLKKTSNRTAENLPQRKLLAVHDAQRGIWSHRTSATACFFGNDRSSHSRVRSRLITKSVYYEWASDSFAYPCPCNNSWYARAYPRVNKKGTESGSLALRQRVLFGHLFEKKND